MVGELERSGVRHVTLNIWTKSVLSWKVYGALPALWRLVKDEKVDIIHAHTRVTQWMACCLQRLTGIPYVTTCHGFFRARIFRRMFPCWGKRVIAISRPVADHLMRDFRMPAERIVFVRSGIDLEKIFPVREEERIRKKADRGYGDDYTLGVIARLSDVKGHRFLIDAMPRIMQEIGRVKLLIVGQGKEEQRLRDQVSRLNLEHAVDFYPVANIMMDCFSLLDCFVMPSVQEGLGLSIMEAQAACLPVVASSVGGIVALIEDGETGLLVEPESSDALADAVVRLFQNPSLAKRLGMQARHKAETEY